MCGNNGGSGSGEREEDAVFPARTSGKSDGGNLLGSPRGFAGQVKGRSEVMWRKRPPSSPSSGVAKAVVDLRKA